MMRSMTMWAGLSAVILGLGCSGDPGAGGAGGGGAEAFPAAPLATVKSDDGALQIEVRTLPQQPPERGLITVEYVVTDAAGKPVDGLDLSVLPWMPEMGHGASTNPEIEAAGSGHYVLHKVPFFMPGKWELRTTFSGAKKESAIVGFQIP